MWEEVACLCVSAAEGTCVQERPGEHDLLRTRAGSTAEKGHRDQSKT